MATYSKPAKVPEWADTGTKVEPSEAKKDSGWVAPELPPDTYFNWWQNLVGQWAKWFNERHFDGGTNDDYKIDAVNNGALDLNAGPSPGATDTGGELTITSGDGGATSGDAGVLSIQGGDSNSGEGGAIEVIGGVGAGAGDGGQIFVRGGQSDVTASPGDVDIRAGNMKTGETDGAGGDAIVSGGQSTGNKGSSATLKAAVAGTSGSTNRVPENFLIADGLNNKIAVYKSIDAVGNGPLSLNAGPSPGATEDGGDFTVTSGDGGATSGDAGLISLQGGDSNSGEGGAIEVISGIGAGAGNGGQVLVRGGQSDVTASPGDVDIRAGNMKTGETDGAGGDAIVSGGQSTGNKGSSTILKAAVAGTSGSTTRAPETFLTADGLNDKITAIKAVDIDASSSDDYAIVAKSDTSSPAKAALRLVPQDADPSVSPAKGDFYINDTDGKLYIYNGSVWSLYVGQVYAALADSSVISNTTAETAYDISFIIPANTLRAGSTIRVSAFGKVDSVSGTPTLLTRMRLGGLTGTEVLHSGTESVTAGHVFSVTSVLTLRAVGASGTVAPNSTIAMRNVGFYANVNVYQATTQSIDTTGALEVVLTATWSAAHVDNQVRLTHLVVDVA